MTFSCSTHFRGEDFISRGRNRADQSEAELPHFGSLGPGPDHPVLLGHGEGEYLTGLVLQDLG